ncbi:uncharacterized protein LOC118205753 [Stegodyphus dumicola]|uniref:uncharacterized protein LOC118205753 n=1 Tax=Stegodyphus dumicola TaxID=202533 RepID=UPI0015AF1833|nr:uncharacterized protein LOC118205753 [Stegodyphus dumicola]
MPDRCCVPECQSNYDKAGTYVSVFKFPKDVEKKSIWCKKIPRRNWSPSARSVVCEKHFIQSDSIRIDEISDRDGTILKVPRKCPKLKEDAYPSIFPNCPKYLTENKPTPRTSRSEKLAKSDEIAFQQFLDKDRIKSFIDFCEQLDLRVNSFNLISKPIVIKNSDHVFLINLNSLSAPRVLSSIKINNDMSLNVFLGDISVPVSHFKIILNNPDNLLRWSELENILSFIKNMQKDDLNEVLPSEKEKSVYHWKKCISPDDVYDNKKFILEQMNLCDKSKMARRYSSELLIFAYSLYMKSSSCYSSLYDSGLLSMPSNDHLGKITSILNLDNSLQNENTKKYMSEKFNKLNDENRIVNLLIDEIYVKKSIAYKGKSISGFAENKSDTEGTTVQAFMISSIYSSYKKTIALVPVNNMNADYLCCLTRKALHILNKAGFSVVSMISDNSRINRNMFQKLGHINKCQLMSATLQNNEKKLFLLFDSVHLLKS